MPKVGDVEEMKRKPPVTWLWKNYVPRYGVSVFQGDMELGKSVVSLDLAARITRGLDMPDSSPAQVEPGAVGIMAKEDSEPQIVHRLLQAGADQDMIVPLLEDEDGPWVLPDHFDLLSEVAHDRSMKLLILDPWLSFVNREKIHPNDTVKMRQFAEDLTAFARKHKMCIIALSHLNKKEGLSASNRGSGSQALLQVARSAYQFGRDPKDHDTCVFAKLKLNEAPTPPSLKYRTTSVVAVEKTDRRNRLTVPRVEWLGTTSLMADDIVNVLRKSTAVEKKRQPRDFAVEYIKTALKDGPRLVSEVKSEAREKHGISEMTFERARRELDVRSLSRKGTQKKYMALPGKEDFTEPTAKRRSNKALPMLPNRSAQPVIGDPSGQDRTNGQVLHSRSEGLGEGQVRGRRTRVRGGLADRSSGARGRGTPSQLNGVVNQSDSSEPKPDGTKKKTLVKPKPEPAVKKPSPKLPKKPKEAAEAVEGPDARLPKAKPLPVPQKTAQDVIKPDEDEPVARRDEKDDPMIFDVRSKLDTLQKQSGVPRRATATGGKSLFPKKS